MRRNRTKALREHGWSSANDDHQIRLKIPTPPGQLEATRNGGIFRKIRHQRIACMRFGPSYQAAVKCGSEVNLCIARERSVHHPPILQRTASPGLHHRNRNFWLASIPGLPSRRPKPHPSFLTCSVLRHAAWSEPSNSSTPNDPKRAPRVPAAAWRRRSGERSGTCRSTEWGIRSVWSVGAELRFERKMVRPSLTGVHVLENRIE
jgi:hypothetical protein